MRTFLRDFFLTAFFTLFALFSGVVPVFAQDDVKLSQAAAGTVPAEKLFYSATLNQSLFISDKEALNNVRVNVKVLQGNLESVTFEMLGQGEVESVNGEDVKDWGIRNSGARRFLEIRPKNSVTSGNEFNATVVGKTQLELPTTMYPPIFASVDATAWTGIMRIVSLPDLRLYARQSRGLIPIGTPTQNELSFGINASPLLRLDVARANELLAPVSLESFSLRGNVDKNSVHFRMRATASVRELGAEIPVLSGEAALRNFPADSAFSVRTEINPKTKTPTYFLKFQQRGDFDLDLEFDALIQDSEGWRALNFAVPAVQVAPFVIDGLGENVLFAPSSVSVPQLREKFYEGFLPASGEFNLRWQNVSGMPPEFSACVFSADTCSEWKIATGVLKQREEIQLMISQGALSNLVFDLYGQGNIVNISGEDLLSWSVEEPEKGRRELHIMLSQKKRGAYSLHVETMTAFSGIPATLEPIRIVPVANQPDSAVCVRFNEFLRLRKDGFVRFDLVPQSGLTQVAPSVFPQRGDYFEKGVPVENFMVYRLSAGTKGVRVQIDEIHPDVSVRQTARFYFDDSKIVSLAKLDMTVRAAPLYDWTIRIPDDFSLTSVDSEKMASYEVGESKDGFRDVKILFTEPLLGDHEIIFAISKDGISSGKSYEVRGVRYPQARFVSGFIGLGGSQKVRLLPVKIDGMTEMPVEFYPIKRSALPQQVFRVRDSGWSAEMRVEKMLSELRGNVSTVYSISPDKIRGNSKISYDSGNELVGEISFELPEDAKLLAATGEWMEEPQNRDGAWFLQLRTPQRGKFSLSVDFEMPSAPSGTFFHADFSGVQLLDVSGESGEIFITSSRSVAIGYVRENVDVVAGKPARILKLARSSVAGADFASRGEPILLGAYQYVERPFEMSLDFVILPEKEFSSVLITNANVWLSDSFEADGLSLKCNYKYLNFGKAKTLSFRVPAGMDFIENDNVSKIADGSCRVKLSEGEGSFSLVFVGIPREKKVSLSLPQFSVPVLSTKVSANGEFEGIDFKNGRELNESFAKFSASLSRIFASGDFGVILTTSVCTLIGMLLLLLPSRRMNSFIRGIFVMIATIATTIIIAGGSFVLFRALSPGYSASEASFGFADSIAFTVNIWSPILPGNGPALGLSILVLGIVFLAAGSVATRLIFIRMIGRILFYGSGLMLIPDPENRIPAIVLVVLAVETFLLLIELYFAVRKRIFPIRVPAEVKSFFVGAFIFAGTGALFTNNLHAAETETKNPLDDIFETLAVQSEVHGSDRIEFSRPQNIAERISQTLKILSDRVVAAGEIRVKGRAGERFDLLESPAVLTRFEKSAPDGAIRLERRRGNNGIVYQIVLERAGTFSANFAYELALKPESRGISLLTGNASADVATVVMMRSDIRVGAENAVTLNSEMGGGGNAQFAQIVFKPVQDRKIFWNPRERDRSGEPLVLLSEGMNLYVPAGGIIEGYHTIRLTSSQGEFDSVSIKIPEPFSVSRVEGNSIRRWNFGRDRTLTVLFDSKKFEPIDISIYTQAALNVANPQNFSALLPLGCEQSVRTVGISTSDDLQIDEISAPGMVALDEKEFPKKLIERAIANEPGAQLRRAFRTVSADSTCRVVLSEVKPNLRISAVDKIVLNRDKILFTADLTAQVSRADVFNLTFVLPDGMEVKSISGDKLGYWAESREDGLRKVTLYLKAQFSGEEKFSISLAGAFPVGSQTWRVPNIIFDDAKHQFGEVFIFAKEGLRLSLRSRDNAVETLPEDDENAELQEADFALRYFGRKWNAVFNVGASQARAEAEWTQEVFPWGRYAFVETKVVYSVENTMRQIVRVNLPKSALAVRFSGDQVINVGRVESIDEKNTWEVRLAKPMRGEIPFTIQYFQPFMPETTIESISVLGVSLQQGSAVVNCGNVLDMGNIVGGNAKFFENAGTWISTDFVGKSVVVKAFPQALADWQSTKTDVSDDVFSDVVSSRLTRVSKKGAVTEDHISLNLSHTELLQIVPAKSEILNVLVNGIPVKLFYDQADSFYIPLYKNREDEKCEIVLLYKNDFSGEFNEVFPVETSAVPQKISWTFSEESPALTVAVLSVFGVVAGDSLSKIQPENGIFVRSVPARTFVKDDGKGSGAPALVTCEPAETSSSAYSKFFILVLAAVILLRILSVALFRTKK